MSDFKEYCDTFDRVAPWLKNPDDEDKSLLKAIATIKRNNVAKMCDLILCEEDEKTKTYNLLKSFSSGYIDECDSIIHDGTSGFHCDDYIFCLEKGLVSEYETGALHAKSHVINAFNTIDKSGL